MRQPKSFTTPLVLFAAVALLAVAGCGSVTTSRESARDQATTVSCNWFQMCGEIGAGKTFATRDACEVSVRANRDAAWPASECAGKINVNQLDICLSAIRSTTCMNGVDFLNTVFNKCPATLVCAPTATMNPG